MQVFNIGGNRDDDPETVVEGNRKVWWIEGRCSLDGGVHQITLGYKDDVDMAYAPTDEL